MSKASHFTAAIGVLSLALHSAAWADAPDPQGTSAGERQSPATTQSMDRSVDQEQGLRMVPVKILGAWYGDDIVGKDVSNRLGRKIGTVDRMIIDEDGKVSYLILDTGTAGQGEGRGGRYAIPWERFIKGSHGTAEDGLVLDVGKRQAEAEFSAFEPDRLPE